MDHGCHWGSSSPAWLKNVGRDRPPSNIAVCRCTSDFFLRDQLSRSPTWFWPGRCFDIGC